MMLLHLQDRNAGLVKQVLASLPARTIQRLTQTYLTLSLADIARAAGLAGPAEAEQVILRMVAHRQVFARINDRDGMVTFMQVGRRGSVWWWFEVCR
jgi:COP9 signalosome complex subunit 3